MLNKILNDIEQSKDELIQGLMNLIELESSDGKTTKAQTFVEKELKELGFEVSAFKGIDERCLNLDDYCPLDSPFHPEAYNVAGVSKSDSDCPSLLLFAHIDTESEEYFGHFDDPYKAEIRNGKIYGLGSSDDKGGIAMMLYALKFVKKHLKTLPFNCTVLSILGKHGGAAGTLSALVKGYRADYGIYLHPAETGHGFAEIKNISLGAVDLNISVSGKPGRQHDDLDTGTNASVLISQIAIWLEEFNQLMRKKHRFDFGSFKNEPSFILNIGSITSSAGYGGICQKAEMKVRIRFFFPLTLSEVISQVKQFLKDKIESSSLMEFSQLTIEKGPLRAGPAVVETESPFVQMIQKHIHDETGINEFVHQYHGGSDIRLPILYGNCQCVGIGPSCNLPEQDSNQREWISADDYLTGIKILARILYHFQNFKTSE